MSFFKGHRHREEANFNFDPASIKLAVQIPKHS